MHQKFKNIQTLKIEAFKNSQSFKNVQTSLYSAAAFKKSNATLVAITSTLYEGRPSILEQGGNLFH